MRKPPAETTPDETLMQGILEGDEEALHTLMMRKAPQIHSFCTRYLGDREEAKDVVQEVFIKVWEQIGKYDSKYAPNTWIYRIATNLCIDHIRSRGSRDKAYQRMFRVLPEDMSHKVALTNLQREEVERILQELSGALSAKQRAVFLLHELEEMDTPTIAKVMKCQQVTVRNHLFHARKIVTQHLRERYPEYAYE
ncbi:MAG TPA: RNA polymerase sigma factor [Thermoanaerobaculia bacterium]|nr:RNA polymerase sigma factor [Thermoanaerobaculia bacterium]HUM31282.1 RNA polymerase sigma factor [Thermoanaerobaculia bacterium]HXK69647.1 RNA polymerase sigma factor [Thermoanaerobaculia bacterium]